MDLSPGSLDAPLSPAIRAQRVRDALPAGGLFAGMDWRTAVDPFPLSPALAGQLENLGRVFLQFYRAANLLYRRSVDGKAPEWVARWLDQGKSAELIELQRHPAFKNDTPRVIRPDLLLTDDGLVVTELDSIPGGIGLTTWLYDAYQAVAPVSSMNPPAADKPARTRSKDRVTRGPAWDDAQFLGSAELMRDGFRGIFGNAPRVHIIVSAESATYRPEMEWLTDGFRTGRYAVQDENFTSWSEGDGVYRFFELFDVDKVPAAWPAFEAARDRRIRLTPPPKPFFEEKLLFALLWNRHLADFWRQEIGEAFFKTLLRIVPYTWALDPTPLPPHGAIPELGLTDWQQLTTLSQRERELILKVSGFSDEAWGARGVYLGSDLSSADWAAAVNRALASWPRSPYVLQRFHKPGLVNTAWYDFDQAAVTPMAGRTRLCPYFFVHGDGDASRPHLGGVLATTCPAEKKIIHGMRDAILAPCIVQPEAEGREDRNVRDARDQGSSSTR